MNIIELNATLWCLDYLVKYARVQDENINQVTYINPANIFNCPNSNMANYTFC